MPRLPKSLFRNNRISSSLQVDKRVSPHAIQLDLKMQVGASGFAGAPAQSNGLALGHRLSYLHVNDAEMGVHSLEAIAMVYQYLAPIASVVPSDDGHVAGVGRLDGRTLWCSDVNGGVVFRISLRDIATDRPAETSCTPLGILGH